MNKIPALKTLLKCETIESAIKFLDNSDTLKEIIYVEYFKSFLYTRSTLYDFPWPLKVMAHYLFILVHNRVPNISYTRAFFNQDDLTLFIYKFFRTQEEAKEYKLANPDVFKNKSVVCQPLENDTPELIRIIYIIVANCGNYGVSQISGVFGINNFSNIPKYDFQSFEEQCNDQEILDITSSVHEEPDAIIGELDFSISICSKRCDKDLGYYKLIVLKALKNIYLKYHKYCAKNPSSQIEFPKPLVELFSGSDSEFSVELFWNRSSVSQEISEMGYWRDNNFFSIAPSLQKNIYAALMDKQQLVLSESMQIQPIEPTVVHIFGKNKKLGSNIYLLPPPSEFLPPQYFFDSDQHIIHCYEKDDLKEIVVFLQKIYNQMSQIAILRFTSKESVFYKAIQFFSRCTVLPVNEVNMIIFTLLQTIFYSQQGPKSAIVLLFSSIIPRVPYKFERYYNLNYLREFKVRFFSSDAERYITLAKRIFYDDCISINFLSSEYCKLKADERVLCAIEDCQSYAKENMHDGITLYRINKTAHRFNELSPLLKILKTIYEVNPNTLFLDESNVNPNQRKWIFWGSEKISPYLIKIERQNYDAVCHAIQEIKAKSDKNIYLKFVHVWIDEHKTKESYNFERFGRKIKDLIYIRNSSIFSFNGINQLGSKRSAAYVVACYAYFKINSENIELLLEAAKGDYLPALADIGLILGYPFMLHGKEIASMEFNNVCIKSLRERVLLELKIPSTKNIRDEADDYLRWAANRQYAGAQYYLFFFLRKGPFINEEQERDLKEKSFYYLREASLRKHIAARRCYLSIKSTSVIENWPSDDIHGVINNYLYEPTFLSLTSSIPPDNFSVWLRDLLELMKWEVISLRFKRPRTEQIKDASPLRQSLLRQ